jgi:hypothetical protein
MAHRAPGLTPVSLPTSGEQQVVAHRPGPVVALDTTILPAVIGRMREPYRALSRQSSDQ